MTFIDNNILKKTHTCDFCGNGFAGEWRLKLHERMCETLPPEIRKLDKHAIHCYRQRELKSLERQGLRTPERRFANKGPRTPVACELKGCRFVAKSLQGLKKHQFSCRNRTVQERIDILERLNYFNKKNGTGYHLKIGRKPRITEPPSLGPALDAAISTAKVVEGLRQITPWRIDPTPIFEGTTNITLSLDIPGLLKLAMDHLPEILPLIKGVNFNRSS